MRPRPSPAPAREFEQLQASVLFCGRCRAPQPVRERLLLVLPDGELYEYLCTACGASVGKRTLTGSAPLVVG
ncbi:MAG: cytoplasmic protein [Acidobacteria bacterium]|nr:MAG: cytoplasmic protein [Acidobacteriota bacterium]PYQ24184.1 MAG: cytoplasmic protein [Acidobacteriota bacterium]